MRVTLFTTCVVDTVFPSVGRACVDLLESLGHEVVYPAEQTCCGQMHLNSGSFRHASRLALRLADVLADAEVIVAPSASCVATIVDDYGFLACVTENRELARATETLAARTFELTQFLGDELGLESLGAVYPSRVAYHPSCHSLRKLRIGDVPSRLLSSVEGLELVPLRDAQTCCGFGGTFAVKNAAVSAAIGNAKVDAIAASGAAVCTALDMSCLMQIQGLLERRGLPVATVHIAEILAARSPVGVK